MTDFIPGGDPATPTVEAAASTDFRSPGASAAKPVENPDDHVVVFEHAGRKFTKAELAKKFDHAETHIQRLLSERAEDRKLLEEVKASLGKQLTAEDLLRQIKEGTTVTTPDPSASAAPATASADTATAVTADVVAAQVMIKLQEGQVALAREANFKDVQTALTNVFGESVNQKVAAVAAEAGITLAEAVEMAKATPKVFLKLFPELSAKAQPSTLGRGVVNTQSFVNTPTGPSGFAKTNNEKASIAIYAARLKASGL